MTINASFFPKAGGGSAESATATSASAEIGVGNKSLCLTNLGTDVVYVRVGLNTPTLTATTDDMPVLAGAQVVISKDQDHTHVAFVCAATESTTLHILPGEGRL